jgi:outer membrane receptor for ferrienterochelin and colicins
MRSESNQLFNVQNLNNDHFNNTSLAAYSNYTYIQSETLEMDFAIRLDHVSVNWLDLSNRVDETILAPRYQVRHDLSDHLSQRFSYGLGYRAPLTFFESQHGNSEDGFEVDITKLEKAHSAVYSLSYNTPTYYATLGVHYTSLQNMAYGFEVQNEPVYFRNANSTYQIWARDLLLGYKPREWWLLEASLEWFSYQDGYTKKIPTAAIEERLQLRSTIDWKKWRHFLNISLVGARGLSRYGRYTDHDVDRKPPGPVERGDELKDQNAPAFIQIDTSIEYKFKKKYYLMFGINNLLDETQVKYGDNPSTWHWHFDHAHYDGTHTWGPNRGREYFLQLSMRI